MSFKKESFTPKKSVLEPFLPGMEQSFSSRKAASSSHGGELRRKLRKIARPFDPKQAIHVVLKSSQAKGEFSLLRSNHAKHVHEFTHRIAKRWGVRIYRYANVGDHLHLLIQVSSRRLWQNFIRELSGGIAMMVTGAKKGSALKKNQAQRGFWDHLVFTRIVDFGREFDRLCKYLVERIFAAMGVPQKHLQDRGVWLRGNLDPPLRI